MCGDDRVRFCDRCRLNVYNIAGMTEPDATELIRRTEGRLCARIYQRVDGTVLVRDCLRAARGLPAPLKIAAVTMALMIPIFLLVTSRDFRAWVADFYPEPVAELIRPESGTPLGQVTVTGTPPPPPPED
jgi:hypothetical protein